MYITKEQFEAIKAKYSPTLVVEGDVTNALDFVHDLLAAEADALQAAEPEATVSIDRLNKAAYEVFEVGQGIENEEFMEQEGGLPKCVSIPVSELQLDDDAFAYGSDGSFYYDRAILVDIGEYLRDTYGHSHSSLHFEFGFNSGKVAEIILTDIQWNVDKEEELTVVRTMDELREYLDDKGWQVNECNFAGGHVGWEIGQSSPAGEDFWFAFEHDNDVEKAVQEIQRSAYDFDIDEHVQLNLGGRGAPGVTELVEDAHAIQEMLDELANGVNWCEKKTIGEMLAAAEERSATTVTYDAVDIDYVKD